MKKLAVIGKGTAGCISAAYWANRVNDKIDWYFDPNKKAQSVGEGANLLVPTFLKNELGWDYNNLSDIDGTFKHGIRKINWGGSGDFIHTFGDAHLYLNHIDQAKLQLSRKTRSLPQLKIRKGVKNIFSFKYDDFTLSDYNPHPHISAPVSV